MKVTWHSDVDAPVVAGNITRDGMVVVTVLVVLVVVVVLMVLVVLVDDLALLMKMIGPTTVMGTGNILPAFPFHSYLEPGQCTPDWIVFGTLVRVVSFVCTSISRSFITPPCHLFWPVLLRWNNFLDVLVRIWRRRAAMCLPQCMPLNSATRQSQRYLPVAFTVPNMPSWNLQPCWVAGPFSLQCLGWSSVTLTVCRYLRGCWNPKTMQNFATMHWYGHR